MLEIFICEDDLVQLKKLEDYVSNYIIMEDLDMKISLSTNKPDEIIDYLEENPTVGLYFLDVDLSFDYNGIALGTKIREHDINGFIVFVTSHPELTYLSFIHKVAALDYIIKTEFEQMKEKIKACIDTAYSRYTHTSTVDRRFEVKMHGKSEFVDFDDILFFETDVNERKIILYTKNRRIKFNGKLNEIEKSHHELWRCHRSFIVNRKNIESIDRVAGVVYMIGGDSCDISKQELQKLKKNTLNLNL